MPPEAAHRRSQPAECPCSGRLRRMAAPDDNERARLAERRDELKKRYVKSLTDAPASNGRRIHHAHVICSDVEQTINSCDGLLGSPLIELPENRDYPGSSHF